MKKFNKKQLLIAALALPLLLASYWIIRCQITSGADHTLKLAITEKTNLDDHGFDIYYKDSIPANKWIKEDCYVSFHTDEDGVSHPSGVSLFPSLCKTSIHADRFYFHRNYEADLTYVCAKHFETDEKNYYWIDRIISNAFEKARVVNAIVDVKKYRSKVASIEIDGKDVIGMIPDALQHPEEMIDTMADRIGKRVEKKCATDYCDPQNRINYMREITTAAISSYLLEAIKYLWNERKQDTSFVAMVQAKAVECYFNYEKLANNDVLGNAVSQLASSYKLVNEDNHRALYDILRQDKEKYSKYYIDYYLGNGDPIRVDRSLYGYASQIKALTHDEQLDPKTLDNIGFWARRWEDGSAETIHQILEKIEKR